MMRRSDARNVAGVPAHERSHRDGLRISQREAREMSRTLNRYLKHGPVRVKTFSGFESAVLSKHDTILAEEAVAQTVTILAAIQQAKGRGVRKQLARLLLLVGRMARTDGYSFRAVAESAASLSQ